MNNLHLLRGMIGRPGAGVLQMNGQPTAQNTRETGADGDLPGLRNWSNRAHIEELARIWNVDPLVIPDWAPPTHAMQIWRYAEQGSIRLLWISATNPAVSLPDLARIRRILADPQLFVVVQDLFLTETAAFADVVLPAAFEAWKVCSAGRPCDYTGITYDLLRRRGGVQWPLGTERLYGDGRFNTDPDYCETYGQDLATGAEHTEEDYVPSAANELTMTAWDPVSRQPLFKVTAVAVTKEG